MLIYLTASEILLMFTPEDFLRGFGIFSSRWFDANLKIKVVTASDSYRMIKNRDKIFLNLFIDHSPTKVSTY